jgi:hypothetical protein
MSSIKSDLHKYLTERGYTRQDTLRDIWLPRGVDPAHWPQDGALALVTVDHYPHGDQPDDDPIRYRVHLVACRPLSSGGYCWDIEGTVPVMPASWEEAVWAAAMTAYGRGLPLSLSVCHLYEAANEEYTSETQEGGNHG